MEALWSALAPLVGAGAAAAALESSSAEVKAFEAEDARRAEAERDFAFDPEQLDRCAACHDCCPVFATAKEGSTPEGSGVRACLCRTMAAFNSTLRFNAS